MITVQRIRDGILSISDTLEQTDIETLYGLYCTTYGRFGNALMSNGEFSRFMGDKYDEVILVEENGEIQNCLVLRTTPYGKRVSLGFGKEDKKACDGRMALLKKTLCSGCYTEANGPTAKYLLKEDTIKLVLVNNPNHYYAHKTSHGKKLVFGTHAEGSEIHPHAKTFFLYLYDYLVIKNQFNLKSLEQDKAQLFAEKISGLYNKINCDTQMPLAYQFILLSKLARKCHSLAPHLMENEALLKPKEALLEESFLGVSLNFLLSSSGDLTCDQQKLANSILTDMTAHISQKIQHTFFKNNLLTTHHVMVKQFRTLYMN